MCFADDSPATVSQDDLRTHLCEHWRITGIDLVHYSAAVDKPTAEHLFDRVSPGIADKLGTDEQGRPTVPMWHLRAERGDARSVADPVRTSRDPVRPRAAPSTGHRRGPRR